MRSRFLFSAGFVIVLVGVGAWILRPTDPPKPVARNTSTELTEEIDPADPTGPVLAGFHPPVRLLGGSDFHGGHPAVTDIDGDDVTDLVMGDADGERPARGRLLVYRNLSATGRYTFAEPSRFDETVPTARLPDG